MRKLDYMDAEYLSMYDSSTRWNFIVSQIEGLGQGMIPRSTIYCLLHLAGAPEDWDHGPYYGSDLSEPLKEALNIMLKWPDLSEQQIIAAQSHLRTLLIRVLKDS